MARSESVAVAVDTALLTRDGDPGVDDVVECVVDSRLRIVASAASSFSSSFFTTSDDMAQVLSNFDNCWKERKKQQQGSRQVSVSYKKVNDQLALFPKMESHSTNNKQQHNNTMIGGIEGFVVSCFGFGFGFCFGFCLVWGVDSFRMYALSLLGALFSVGPQRPPWSSWTKQAMSWVAVKAQQPTTGFVSLLDGGVSS